MKKTKTMPAGLSAEELSKLESVSLSDERLKQARDLFLMSAYTSMSFGELEHFDAANIIEKKRDLIYVGVRNKTGEVVLSDSARHIIDRYKGKMPAMSLARFNSYMKLVGVAAGITTQLTSHCARLTGVSRHCYYNGN